MSNSSRSQSAGHSMSDTHELSGRLNTFQSSRLVGAAALPNSHQLPAVDILASLPTGGIADHAPRHLGGCGQLHQHRPISQDANPNYVYSPTSTLTYSRCVGSPSTTTAADGPASIAFPSLTSPLWSHPCVGWDVMPRGGLDEGRLIPANARTPNIIALSRIGDSPDGVVKQVRCLSPSSPNHLQQGPQQCCWESKASLSIPTLPSGDAQPRSPTQTTLAFTHRNRSPSAILQQRSGLGHGVNSIVQLTSLRHPVDRTAAAICDEGSGAQSFAATGQQQQRPLFERANYIHRGVDDDEGMVASPALCLLDVSETSACEEVRNAHAAIVGDEACGASSDSLPRSPLCVLGMPVLAGRVVLNTNRYRHTPYPQEESANAVSRAPADGSRVIPPQSVVPEVDAGPREQSRCGNVLFGDSQVLSEYGAEGFAVPQTHRHPHDEGPVHRAPPWPSPDPNGLYSLRAAPSPPRLGTAHHQAALFVQAALK